MKKRAPFKLLYNNDTTNVVNCISPWHEDGELFREGMLIESIAEVAGTGVDAYMLSPGFGWVPWWQSNVEPGFFEWWKERTGLGVVGYGNQGFEKYVCEGGDMVQVLIDTCRKHEMAPFVSLRMNDVHFQENYAQKNQMSLVSCRLYAEHPEWHLHPDHPQQKGYSKSRGMNWAVPEVREYKLALIRELADKYDLAGLELDFLRDDYMFREEVAESDRVAIMTEFVREVRTVLGKGSGSRRWLCARIPLQLSCHAHTGLDAGALQEAGVDMFNLSGWFDTTQQFDIAPVRQLAPDAAIYLEMTHSAGYHRYFSRPTLYGNISNPRTSDHQFYTTARLALEQGADGISLFNFVYYRGKDLEFDVPVTEPPFHVFKKLADRSFLERQGHYYFLGKGSYFSQVPKDLSPGEPAVFQMDMLKPAAECAPPHQGRLRLHLLHPCSEDNCLKVTFNGQDLKQTPKVSRLFNNPFDNMISPHTHRCAFILPPGLLDKGINELCVTGNSEPVRIIYVDCSVPPPMLQPLQHRPPNILLETQPVS